MDEDELVRASAEPKIDALIEEYGECGSGRPDGSAFWLDDVRMATWRGQSPDGRKWDKNLQEGARAFPFDGASDTRIRLADEIINELVSVEVVAFWRAMLRVQAVGPEDLSGAQHATKYLRWLVGTKQYRELVSEVELHSQYTHHFGWSVLYVAWEREKVLKLQTRTMTEVIQLAEQAQGTVLETLPMMIADPTQEAEAVDMIEKLLGVSKRTARRAVRDLRTKQIAEIPVPEVVRDEPVIEALKPYEQVLFRQTTTDIQKASAVFVRRAMSEVELRAKISDDDWDEEWVEKAIKAKGHSMAFAVGDPDQAFQKRRMEFSWMDCKNDLIEVVYAYTRALDEDNVPGIYCTIFHPKVNKGDRGQPLYAKHELLDYAHGKMPFVVRRRENWSRQIMASRGVPEIVSTWQNEIKTQRDSLADNTSFSVLPPIIVPSILGVDYRLGPAVQVPEARPGHAPRFMDMPARGAPIAFNLIEKIEAQVDNYFGRQGPDTPPARAQGKQQLMVQSNLLSWTEAYQQEFALVQQYVAPEEFQRVTGAPPDFQLGEFKGFDFILAFDVRELDTDFMVQKLTAIKDLVLPVDSEGMVDRSKLVTILLRAIDPSIAEEIVSDPQAASARMIEGVGKDLAAQFLGNEANYVENDPAAERKLEIAQKIVAANPKYQQALQTDEHFQALIENYTKNLQQSIAQKENMGTGRTGVKPVNQNGGRGMGGMGRMGGM